MTLQTSAKILRPITRASMGVLHPGSLSLASAARAETFALGVLQRHSSTYAGVAPVEAILRARPDTTVANVFQMIDELAVRIELMSQRASSPRAPGAVRPPPAPTLTLGRAAPERPSPSPGHAILERLFAREHRIESLLERELAPASSPTGSGDQATVREAPVPAGWSPVEMVVRREVVPRHAEPAARSARERAPSAARGPAGLGAAHPAPFTPAVTPLSASDLGRITDEVVRTIDRRIIAQRERKGGI